MTTPTPDYNYTPTREYTATQNPTTPTILIEKIISLFPFSSNDPTRPAMAGVHIHTTPEGIRLEATNGIIGKKVLVKFSEMGDRHNETKIKNMFLEEKFIISNSKRNISELKSLLKYLKTEKRIYNPNFYFNDTQKSCLTFETARKHAFLDLICLDFPKLSQIIDGTKKEEDYIKVTFTPEELETIVKLYKQEKKDYKLDPDYKKDIKPNLTMFFKKSNKRKAKTVLDIRVNSELRDTKDQSLDPIFITNDKNINSDNVAIIMPCRI